MKAIKNSSQTLYFKQRTIDWNQPLLSSNGNYGIDEFAVYRNSSNGGYSGGDAWQAFASTSGYDGHWTGNYGDEYQTCLYLYMAVKNPIIVTGFSLYVPCTQSASDWGSTNSGGLQYSDDNSNWVTMGTHGSYGTNSSISVSFENSTPHKYYRYYIYSHGSGHKDLIQVSSFRLTAYRVCVDKGTESDYTSSLIVPSYKMRYADSKYYGLGK